MRAQTVVDALGALGEGHRGSCDGVVVKLL